MISKTLNKPLLVSWRSLRFGRVRYWRALFDAVLVCTLLIVLLTLVQLAVARPWSDMFNYSSFVFYLWIAWRLAPGSGSLGRRGARALSWATLFGLLNGIIWWLIYAVSSFGTNLAAAHAQLAIGSAIINFVLATYSLFIPTRTLLALWQAGQQRLRWRLTHSYLLIGVITTVVASLVVSIYQLEALPNSPQTLVAVLIDGVALAVALLLPTSLVVLPVALGAGFLLARQLSLRLEQVVAATRLLARGTGVKRIEVTSRDEIGQLGADFNTMAARLAEREQALRHEKERAERLLAANRRLVANVSHELRTPLTTLRGYLDALHESHGPQLPARDMQVIQGEIGRLTQLIDDLFTLARAEAQQLPLTIAALDAAALVRSLVTTLAPLARRERQIEVVDALPEYLPAVLADRQRLEQVLLNLAQNALRHTPPGGIVAFEAHSTGDTVTLTVADTGIGIAPEELALVFERFYRGDASRARETGGAGLGLALVKELVEAMGGSVVAESVPGQGSRFCVTLRCAP